MPTLEHFRFPEIFLRHTKKTYISFVTPEMIEEMILTKGFERVPTKNAITHPCQRRHIPMDMYLTRKIFASHLIQSGIVDVNTVDMLQGRCPPGSPPDVLRFSLSLTTITLRFTIP